MRVYFFNVSRPRAQVPTRELVALPCDRCATCVVQGHPHDCTPQPVLAAQQPVPAARERGYLDRLHRVVLMRPGAVS